MPGEQQFSKLGAFFDKFCLLGQAYTQENTVYSEIRGTYS